MQKIINESTVLNFYLEQMENDQITFLIGKEESKKKIAGLILKLDEFTDIHQKIQVAKDLWKILFEESMRKIHPDKRGYDKLFKYFDEYVNFEELIFASDSFYRDHTLHCLWVYFLGEYLYCQNEFKSIFKYIFEANTSVYEMEKIYEMEEYKGAFKEVIEFLKPINSVMQNSDALRCLAALTHDLGYPLKKIKKINKSIGSILPYFSISNFNEFDFSYTNEQSASVEAFLQLLSLELHVNVTADSKEAAGILEKIAERDKTKKGLFNLKALSKCSEQEIDVLRELKPVVLCHNSLSRKARYGQDFENYEHGIMSAFILYTTLMSNRMCKITLRKDGTVEKGDLDLDLLHSLQIIYEAVSDHTSPAMKIKSINNPSAFLILIDELEEFSRISRANQNRQYISEFCKSSIYMEGEVFCVDFVFDNHEIMGLDPERAFKGRCAKMLNLFDIPDLDEDFKLRLRCLDQLHDVEKIYELSIAHKYANITIDGAEKNIPRYLKSRELYSKDEYVGL